MAAVRDRNMKRNRVIVTALICLFLPLWGCYESRFPLGPPEAATETRLIGNWRCVQGDEDNEKPFVLTIMSFDEKQYYAGLAMEGEKTLHYRAFSTPVRGTTLLNVQEIEAAPEPAKRKWFFVRYRLLRDNILHVEIVREEPFKGIDPSPSAVREILEGKIESPELYRDFCVCTKIVEPKRVY